jgi:hypothetical protein
MVKTAPPEPAIDERDRPVRTMIALVVGFLIVVVIAVVTVLVPELGDDSGEQTEDAPATEARAAPR